MAVPSLKLNLAPPSNLWRMNHAVIGWTALAGGTLLLAASLGFSWRAYAQAIKAGKQTVTLETQTSKSAEEERRVIAELRSLDVAKELPRWRLAEKIFTERSLPWSRLTAELERSLVEDVRLKSIQRTRGTDLKVEIKIKGEANTRKAEAAFVESLQKNPFFEAVLLEREGERQGGGVDFEYTLAAQSIPPAFIPLPKQPKYASAASTQVHPGAKPATPAVRTPGLPVQPGHPAPLANPATGRTTPAVPPGKAFTPAQPTGRFPVAAPNLNQPIPPRVQPFQTEGRGRPVRPRAAQQEMP